MADTPKAPEWKCYEDVLANIFEEFSKTLQEILNSELEASLMAQLPKMVSQIGNLTHETNQVLGSIRTFFRYCEECRG